MAQIAESDGGGTPKPKTTYTPRPRRAKTADRGAASSAPLPTPPPAIPVPKRVQPIREGREGAGPQPERYIPARYSPGVSRTPFWEEAGFPNFVSTIKNDRTTAASTLAADQQSKALTPSPAYKEIQAERDAIQQRTEIRQDREQRKRQLREQVSDQALQEIMASFQAPPSANAAQHRETQDQLAQLAQQYLNTPEVQKMIDEQAAMSLSALEWQERQLAQQFQIYRQGKENEALRNQIRQDVIGGIQPSRFNQISKEQAQQLIDKEVNRRMEAYKPPRYFYITDENGNQVPVYMTPADESRARDAEHRAYIDSIADRPWYERAWLRLKHDPIYQLSKVSRFLGEASVAAKEWITDDEPTNVLGALAETGLNVAILAGEWVSGGVVNNLTPISAVEAEIAKLKAENNPGNAYSLARLEKTLIYQKDVERRIREARLAVERSWAEVNNRQDYIQQHGLPTPLNLSSTMNQTTIENVVSHEEQLVQERQQATQDAKTFRDAALAEYAAGNYDAAVSLIKQAQAADRKTSAYDPYGAYSWVREPEREERFLFNTAIAEIQKGGPLTRDEIRMIKEHDVNAGTELLGEFIYDPLNLIPASVMESVVGVPIRITGKAIDNIPILGSAVKWLRRPSVVSAGNKIADEVHNVLQQVTRSFNSVDDVERAVNDVSDLIMQAKRLDPKEVEAFYDAQRLTSPTLQNLTLRQFKELMNAGDVLDPTQWASAYRRALDNAEDDLTKLALAKGQDPAELISDASKHRRALDMVAEQFKNSYVDPHKVFKFKDGMAFTDDTITGWVSKTMRNLSGDDINEALKLNKFDEAIRAYSQTLKPATKTFISSANRIMEGVLHAGVIMRDMWVKMVLSTPRWPILNLADTSMRYTVSGGNLWDSLASLFTSTQKTFADELGIIPREITQSVASAGVDISEHVTSKLLYEGYKPKAGLFSWWKEEFKRLNMTDQMLAKRELLNRALSGLPDGAFKSALTWLGDGLSLKTAAVLDAFPGAVRNFNDSIEFTFRLRMFHDTYYKALEALEPRFLSRAMEGLSPGTKQIAEIIFRESENNPARIKAYVDSLLGKSKSGMPAEWSALVPNEVLDATKGMDATNRQLFIREFRSSVEEYLQTAAKNGRKVTGDDLVKFVDDYTVEMKNNIQAAMAQTYDVRNATGIIRKDGKTNPVLTQTDLKGSAPLPPSEMPRAEIISRATAQVKKSKPFQKTTDIADNFSAAVSDYAEVQRVAGDGVRRIVTPEGKTVIEIGDNVLKGKPAQMYGRLNEALMDVFKHTDEDTVLRGGFETLDQYDETVRKFMADPAALLRDNERQFMTITQQFTNHPQLRQLIEQTGKSFKFDSLMDVYRKYGAYDNAYGFYRPIDDELEDLIQKKRPLPGRVVVTSTNEAQATARLSQRAERLTDEAFKTKLGQFREQWYAYRQELHTFYRKVYPGPLMRDIGGVRRKTWDIYYNSIADAYEAETKIKNTLLDLLDSDPMQAQRYVDDALENFSDYFLRENGVKVVWDADHQKILDVTVTLNGRNRKLVDPLSRSALENYFYQTKKINEIIKTPTLRVNALGQVNIKTQLTNTLRDTFELSTTQAETWAKVIENHAQLWAKETGQDVSKYFERLGFKKVDNLYGLASKNEFRIMARGAVQREEGAFIFYGLGQSNFESMVRETGELFFDDMVSMAEHSSRAADDLQAVKKFIEAKTGLPVLAGKLNQQQAEVFTELFTRYVSEGMTDSLSLKPAFEKFKSYLAKTFDAVHTADLPISDDIYQTMNRLFIEDKMLVKPTSNTRSVKLMAREAGFEFADDDELLKFINERAFPSPGTTADTPIAREVYQNIKKNPELAKKLGANIPAKERRLARAPVEADLRKSLYQRTLDNWDNLTKEEQKLTGASKWIDEATGLENKNAFSHDATGDIKNPVNPPPGTYNTIIDANSLTALNYHGGHGVGDAFIKEIGHQINEVVDEILGKGQGRRFRFGGDEFVIWHDDPAMGQRIGEALDERFKQVKIYVADDQGNEVMIEGLSISHGTGDTFDVADKALYQNKVVKSEMGLRPPIGPGVDKNTLPPGLKFTPQEAQLENIPVGDAADLTRQVEKQSILTSLDGDEWDTDTIIEYARQNGATQQQIRDLIDLKSNISDLTSSPVIRDRERRLIAKAADEFAQEAKNIIGGLPISSVQPSDIVQQAVPTSAPRVGYTDLADVPKDVAQRVFGTMEAPLDSTVVREINEAWEVWKTQRSFTGFPESALVSPDTFKAYLTERMGQEWSEVSWHYNRMMADLESFENAVMNYHSGATDALQFNMRVPDSMLSDGQKVWIRNNEAMIRNYESALQALDAWKPHLKDLMDGKSPLLSLTKAQKDELAQWAVRASKDRAEMMDVAMNGGNAFGKSYEGAINKTNRFMIDYQHTSVFDQFMKNIFPFWKFPSRSLPFWMETMATHPQLIAAYEKIQRMSRTQRYQGGAITSSGKPLPSLDGYVKIPGTDMWFNPLAPLSFRYVLDTAKRLDDMAYSEAEDVEPKAFLAKEFLETSQIYGFSTPPWITVLMKKAFNLPDSAVPAYPLTPQVSLIPRWFVKDMINKANQINFGGTGLGDTIYPEVSWHDYLVEQRIYENTLQKLQDDNLSLEERDRLRKEVSDAIKYKNNDLWNSTYKAITTDASLRSMGSFFTGVYATEFSDAQADLRRLKFNNNLLKSAINNEFQSVIFNLPDAEQKYYDNFDTDEGWLYRLYTESGWVKDDLGNPVSGKERAKWLAIHIEENEYNEQYHDEMSGLQQKYNERLRSMPLGTPYSEMKPIYDWYQEQRGIIDGKYAGKFPVEKNFYTSKSAETLQKELRTDYFRLVQELKPVWKPESGESYQEYQQRVQDWYEKLPEMAPQLMLAFQRQGDTVHQMNALQKDQQLSPSFFKDLISQTNREGMLQWRKESDDIMDAMNNAWEALYWNRYWESGVTQKGYAGDLAQAEFESRYHAPTSTEIHGWLLQEYGNRFSFADVQKIMGEAGQLDIEERQKIGKPEDYTTRQEIWDMLSWLGPGSRNSTIFNQTFEKLGGNPDYLTVWYEEGGQAFQTKPDKLQELHAVLKDTMATLNLQAPKRAELVRYTQAQEQNEQFRQLVSEELGDGFYDTTNPDTGEIQQGLLSYYSELDTKAKKEFRRTNPEQYGIIKDYYNLKESFGESNPVWNEYYGFDTTPSVSTEGVEFTSPTYSGGSFTAPQTVKTERSPAPPLPMPRGTQGSQKVTIPTLRVPSRLPSDLQDFPYAFQNALGDKMMWEVTQLYTNRRRLSSAAARYLTGIASRHPEWNRYIQEILDKNST